MNETDLEDAVLRVAAQQASFDGWVSFTFAPAGAAAARLHEQGVFSRVDASTVLPAADGWAYRVRQ